MKIHPAFVLPVLEGDTPIGYASKLAFRVGRYIRSFLRDAEIDFYSLANGDPEAVERLCDTCDLAGDSFAHSTIVKLPRKRFLMAGQTLAIDQVARDALRLCPLCVEDAISRPDGILTMSVNSHWHILPLHVCPIHNVRIDRVSLSTPSRHLDHDFISKLQLANREGALRTMDRSDATPSPLEHYVRDVLSGRPQDHWLSSMPLYAAIKVAQLVGAEVQGVKERRWGGMTPSTLQEVGAIGYELLKEGAMGLRKVFAEAQRKYFETHSFSGKLSMFGRVYRFLAEDCDDPAFEPAREVLRSHIIEETPVGPGDTALGVPVTSRTLHSVRSVSRELGVVAPTAASRLAWVGILDDRTQHLSPDQRTFRVAENAEKLRRLKGALLRGDAGRYLGIDRIYPGIDKVLDLVGSLNVVKTPTTQQIYAKEDLDRYLDSILSKAKNGSTAGFSIVADAASKAHSSIVEILEMIRVGDLREVRISSRHKGIMSLMVRPTEVRACIVAKRTWLPLVDAKKWLRVSQSTLATVIAMDLLALRAGQPKSIEKADLLKFAQTYISMSEIFRAYQPLRAQHPTRWTFLEELDRLGAVRVVDRGRYPIYRRDDVERLLGPPPSPPS